MKKKLMIMALLGLSTSIATAQVRAEVAIKKAIIDRDSTDGEILLTLKTPSMTYEQNPTIVGTTELFKQIADAKPKRFLIEFEVINHRNHVEILKITLLALRDKNGKKIGEDIPIFDASTANNY
jgi:hypothetical protein